MKTWDELGLEEKLERLREVLRTKEFAIRELREQIGGLMFHQHGQNGELLRPMHHGLDLDSSSGRLYDPLA